MSNEIITVLNSAELTDAISTILPEELTLDDVAFLCIGSDRSTGDALGPLVGHMLRDQGYENVYGTLEYPVHSENLLDTLSIMQPGKTVIAVVATLGRSESIGKVTVGRRSVRPGAGVGNYRLPEIGHYSITGVVNIAGYLEYQVINNSRLSTVMRMADDITAGLMARFPKEGGES